MIEIKTNNNYHEKNVFDVEFTVQGRGYCIARELIVIFDHFYKVMPEVFEAALVACKYTKDHT